tara:strand:- start:532 stop:1047 length:516 start_codon:yes stop_codon:yes gene_type:complete
MKGATLPEREEVNNMDNTDWDSLVIEVNEYLEADTTLDAGLKQVVELNLQIGTNNPNERDAATGALKALLKGRDGTPFRRGQKSAVPASVRVSIDRICGVVEEAALGFYNHDAIIGAISMKHIKSGGGQFADADEYAGAVVKRTRNNLSKMFKDGSWDGSLDSLLGDSSEE